MSKKDFFQSKLSATLDSWGIFFTQILEITASPTMCCLCWHAYPEWMSYQLSRCLCTWQMLFLFCLFSKGFIAFPQICLWAKHWPVNCKFLLFSSCCIFLCAVICKSSWVSCCSESRPFFIPSPSLVVAQVVCLLDVVWLVPYDALWYFHTADSWGGEIWVLIFIRMGWIFHGYVYPQCSLAEGYWLTATHDSSKW